MLNWILDFVFEFIFEIIFWIDDSEDIKKRLPLPVRILLFIIALCVYIGLIVLVTKGVINTFNSGKYKLHSFLVVVDLLLVAGLVYYVVMMIKKRRK